ncbi:voltage-gated potassium channel [Pseudarthrobacter oxydans]|uniref:ion transporter n=1 Tax=Pseudarthrobacter oxydans TaxID=1671 RepID=UPI00277D62AD|nr:ion transporter [Pseudarthrobacter oxydans]MDP9983916.1 voltage-gated potassium channel [Pseudarthrobacter oxydans]
MTNERSELKSVGYEIFIGILSILSIVNLVLLYVVREKSLDTVLTVMNALFSVIFVVDFLYRIVTAPSAGAYFFRHFGWADLLASVPLAQFKILRAFRLVRVYRLLRDVGTRTVGRALIKDRAGSSLYILLLMGIFVLEFGSLMILGVEEGAPGANITTASDALWYTIVTISTVGYGDQYPVTDAGRMIGTGIIIVGVGIFGTFTGYLANFFLSPRKKSSAPTAAEAGSRTATVEGLRLSLEESEAKLAEIRKLLAGPTQ